MTYVILSKPECLYCQKAKDLLHEHYLEFREFNVLEHPSLYEFLTSQGLTTVPQLYENGFYVGGYQDFHYELKGTYDPF